jgi:hypothetical protein
MLRTYIYNEIKNAWFEEDSLLLHDLCAIFDEEDKVIYLWSGPKISSERLEKGNKSIEILLSNFPEMNLKVIKLKKKISPKIQERIDKMLESLHNEDDDEYQKLTRLSSIRIYFSSTLTVIVLSIISLLNILRYFNLFNWSENLVIKAKIYDSWLSTSKILSFLCLVLFALNISIGILEKEHQIIVFSAIGLIISIGIFLYLSQGIFLFLFQPGSDSSEYVISQIDINFFSLFLLSSELIYLIPTIYKFIIFTLKYREFII